MSDWVYLFEEGDSTMRELLGGKGAGLAGMTRAGLPVPPGFTITTEACREYYGHDKLLPEGLWEQSRDALATIEEKTGKRFGDPENPLLVSVRSGASVSMPGMMDTVLNLGLNEETLQGLASLTNDERFAWDAYRRFVAMYGEIVLGVPKYKLDREMERVDGFKHESDLDIDTLQHIVRRYKEVILGETRQELPEDPEDQLKQAIAAVFDSWMNARSIEYRRVNDIPEDLGTAVTVQTMVFGNAGADSGTGVAFTRDPNTGERRMFGEYLTNAQGEDVVAGIRTPSPISRMAEELPDTYRQLLEIATRLETHYRDMQDIEFTIEHGKLYMLQTRTGKRTGRAAVRIAVDMVNEGIIEKEEAVMRVSPDQLEQLLHPVVDPNAEAVMLAQGLPASPGAASGQVVFNADEAKALAEEGQKVILVRQETNPDDYHGMVGAQAVVTTRGGMTSHAAVVARGMGKSCVVGVKDMHVDYGEQLFTANGHSVSSGEWITVDGNEGRILLGEVETINPELDENFSTLMRWANSVRELGIRTNADNGEDAAVARRFGAQGIGLCRTEHMFFEGDRIIAMRDMIMSPNSVARAEALNRLEPYQVRDFEALFEAMDGYPVTIRLLDPPLHEFLPSHEDTALEITDLKLQLRSAASLEEVDQLLHQINAKEEILGQVERLTEANPMLGHRGCRLGIVYPEITEMQARAIFMAAIRCKKRGIDVQPEVMIPLISFTSELENQAAIVREIAEEVFSEQGMRVDYHIGTMIELPRAALTAGQVAEVAEFFSFGTNDLTQTTLGLSRDDAGRFLPGYVERGIMPSDPFQTIDVEGVGSLVELATERGRRANPTLKVGICGEHGGDPASVDFFHRTGLDYVSCSPYRVPVAILSAAQAAVRHEKAPAV